MNNKYMINGDKSIIYIESQKYGTKEVLIDTDDLFKVLEFNRKWSLLSSNGCNTIYAVLQCRDQGKRKTLLMHRFLINAQKNKEVDHINRNGIDNRKSNLRETSRKENSQNVDKRKNNKSGYRNVCWHKNKCRWAVSFKKDGKTVHGGNYLLLKDAVIAAEKMRKELFPFAC